MQTSELQKRWARFAEQYSSTTWSFRDLPAEHAEVGIVHLYHQLDEYDCVSGWVGPLCRYGGGYEKFFAFPGDDYRSSLLRNGSLIMLLFAAWCSAEESYALSPTISETLLELIGELRPYNDCHGKLIETTSFALELMNQHGVYNNWSRMDVFRLDRESRSILNQIVRTSLQDFAS